MTFRKQSPISLQLKYAITSIAILTFWLLLLLFWFPNSNPADSALLTTTQHHHHNNDPNLTVKTSSSSSLSSLSLPSSCDGAVSVYVYELPPQFNLELLHDCKHLNIYTDMCPHVANSGLGQPMISSLSDKAAEGITTNTGGGDGGRGGGRSWFATHQFIAEMIFHARLIKHPCRTWDPSTADLFYVPFYGGLHVSSKFRETNLTARDELAIDLVGYLKGQYWWKRHQGRDHFLALGRTSWDFMRTSDGTDFGANCLLNLPHVLNMSVLTVERHPWKGSNQYGIPYPSYFHPSTWHEMLLWQKDVSRSPRPHLFSFIGGTRKGVEKAAVRDELIKQCAESTRCELLRCGRGGSKCHKPIEVLNVMKRSDFCLQAPGDSFTRRSTFDSVLAGCIPVFFSPHTAYSQYAWYLPNDRSEYSVYMDQEVNGTEIAIEEELLKIPKKRVERMRRTVINLIPKLTYVNPNATDHRFHDAVDVALLALAKKVKSKLAELQRRPIQRR